MTTVGELAAGIVADARLQAARIEAEGAHEAQRIRQETEEMAARQRAALEEMATQQRKELDARAHAKRELAARQETLVCKQELLEEVFAAAQHALEGLPAAKRRALIVKLLDRARRQMPIGSVKASPRDLKSIKGLRTTPSQCSGGFIAISKDGTTRIDMRFPTLLDNVKRRKTAEIAEALFNESKPATPRPSKMTDTRRRAGRLARPRKMARIERTKRPARSKR